MLEVQPDELEGRNQRSAFFKTMFMAFRAAGAKDWKSKLIENAGAGAFAAQCIPTALELLEVSRYKDFLAERRKLISKRLNEFLSSAAQG
ncbi:MAG: hypothetical protein ACK5DR_20245 [Planctomyces sp.]